MNKAIGFVLMFAAILIAELQPNFLKIRQISKREAQEEQTATRKSNVIIHIIAHYRTISSKIVELYILK